MLFCFIFYEIKFFDRGSLNFQINSFDFGSGWTEKPGQESAHWLIIRVNISKLIIWNHRLDWRILLAFWFISKILESISFIFSGKLFYLLFSNLFLSMFEFADPLIFMCSFPFFGSFSASKSLIPITISEILSVEPRFIASSSIA